MGLHKRYTVAMKVQNKTIVVTGAGGGIGSALVRELLRRGARVAAVDLREEGLRALKKQSFRCRKTESACAGYY